MIEALTWLLGGLAVGFGGHGIGIRMERRGERSELPGVEREETSGLERAGFFLRLVSYIAAAACLGQALGALVR